MIAADQARDLRRQAVADQYQDFLKNLSAQIEKAAIEQRRQVEVVVTEYPGVESVIREAGYRVEVVANPSNDPVNASDIEFTLRISW